MTVPAPTALAAPVFASSTSPAFTVRPLKVLLVPPPSVRVPVPDFVRRTAPPIEPPTVRLGPLMVTVRAAESVTDPVPRSSASGPSTVKLPFQACTLLPATVRAAPLELTIVPPVIVNVPVPRAHW